MACPKAAASPMAMLVLQSTTLGVKGRVVLVSVQQLVIQSLASARLDVSAWLRPTWLNLDLTHDKACTGWKLLLAM